MNRRDLLKRIGLTVPAVVGAVMVIEVKPETPDEFMFHGWKVRWRGWREVENMDVKVGM